MPDEEFEKLVEKAVDGLPEEFLKKLENVSIVTQDYPSRSQTDFLHSRGERGFLLGLYQGIPRTRRGNYGIGGVLPDKITIFKIPLLMISRTKSQIEKNVRDTVIHEIAHHFGMSDLEIHKKLGGEN